MMNVSSIGANSVGASGAASGAGAVGRAESRVTPPTQDQAAERARRGEDRVELSEASRLLARLQGMPEIRQELVDRVRAEIESGSYETPEKIDQAIEAMMDELEQGL